MNARLAARVAKPYPGNRRRLRRLDPALRAAEEIGALLVIFFVIGVVGTVVERIAGPVLNPPQQVAR